MSLFFLVGKLFALTIGCYYFRVLPKPYKLILIVVLLATFCEGYGFYMNYYLHIKNNLWLFNLYMFFEAALLGIAAIYLVKNRRIKFIFLLLLVVNASIWCEVIHIHTVYLFASTSMITGSAILTLIYIIVLFDNSLFARNNILNQPVFWLSISNILFFGCDIPFMGLQNFLSEEMPKLGTKLVNINDILDGIRYPLVGISFLLLGKNKNSESKPG